MGSNSELRKEWCVNQWVEETEGGQENSGLYVEKGVKAMNIRNWGGGGGKLLLTEQNREPSLRKQKPTLGSEEIEEEKCPTRFLKPKKIIFRMISVC